MKGLELSKEYFKEFGLPMLERDFKEELNKMTIGLVGHGSECFGFDDEISKDHDFEPGFSIWLSDSDYEEFGFKLFRAYSKLPKEYKGLINSDKSALGPKYKGVHTVKEFYSFYIGSNGLPKTLDDWMNIPDYYLAEATNGELFINNNKEFNEMREYLLNRPEDVRLKKLSSLVFHMAQAGQYNYKRCMDHNEPLAASLELNSFARSTAKVIYLLNNKYAPYDKWLFKGLDDLKILGHIKSYLITLLEKPYDVESNIPLIELISNMVSNEIRKAGLSDKTDNYLEPYAYCILNKVKDANLRNTSIMIDEEE